MTAGRWRCRLPLLVDVAVAVFFVLLDTGLTLVGGSWWPAHPGVLAWTLLGVQAAACLSLILRRWFPLTMVLIFAGFTLALSLLIWPLGVLTPAHDGSVWAPYATVAAAYAPVLGSGNRRRGFLAVVVLTVIVARPWDPSAMVIVVGLLRTAIGPILALYFQARRRLVLALTERAERAEREQHLLAEQARADERARLAGEMHDVVTHRVSLMVLQAGALRMTAVDQQTRQAAEELRHSGCQALDELRDLVGILRAPAVDDEPPSTAGLAVLVAESAESGTPTELVSEGDPELASPVVGRTAYRIVREALTNVRKHAPGARTVVRMSYGPDRVRATIENGPAAAAADPVLAGSGSGAGLVGLRQRIELIDGTLRAGPAPDGGFRVEASLPAYVATVEAMV